MPEVVHHTTIKQIINTIIKELETHGIKASYETVGGLIEITIRLPYAGVEVPVYTGSIGIIEIGDVHIDFDGHILNIDVKGGNVYTLKNVIPRFDRYSNVLKIFACKESEVETFNVNTVIYLLLATKKA